MAGLLDSFLPEDEIKRNAALQGALSAGLGIMANSYNPGGRFGPAIGAGGLQGMQAYQSAIENAQSQRVRDMQLKQMQQKMADEESMRKFDFGQFYKTPQQQAIEKYGPTPEGAAAISQFQPTLDTQGLIAGMMRSGNPALVNQGIGMMQKDETPITLAEGARLVTRGGREIAKNPKMDLKEGFLIPDEKGGYRIDPTLFEAQRILKATSAPKVSVSPTVKVGSTFAEGVAKQGAERLFGQVEAASSAPEMSGAANQILAAIDTGKVIAGPGATWKIAGSQIFGGDPTKLQATRATIQGLAKLSLQGRQSLKGQGSITDSEQKMLARASSGDIDEMSVDEIRLIAQGAIKNAQTVHSQGKKAASALSSMPEFRQILPAFSLPEMPSQPAMPLPANPKASDLVKGQIYMTPRGQATWNGMQFVKE